MIILSNGFPTNMPNSEKVSQGGPANFARLFYSYMAPSGKDLWVGMMFKNSSLRAPRIKKAVALPGREYYRLYLPKDQLREITKAKAVKDPTVVLQDSIARLAAFIRQIRPDVVFLNGFGVFNWMLLKAAQQEGVPAVIQHAGILTKELDVQRKLFSVAGRKMMEEMEKDSTRLTSAEIFLNEWSKNYYRTNVAERDNRHTHIVPLPFDFETFAKMAPSDESSRSARDAELQIGVIARWDEIKNHDTILALAKEAKRRGLPWQFHAVTDIPDRYRQKKRAYEQHIRVTPSLDRAGISRFCRSMDLLIQPSLFDVSPTVVLEAIASDTPIAISRNVGYVNDFMAHGAGAWAFDWSATDKTIAAIKKIAGKPMPRALREHLVSAHDHKQVFSTYLRLFAEVGSRA